MLELVWNKIGPARPQGAAVPPVSMSLNGYVLAYDAKAGRTLYLCGTGYDGFGETWSFDGTTWTKLGGELLNFGDEGKHQGGYDSARGCVVGWKFGTDYGEGDDAEERKIPRGALLTANGLEEFKNTGTVEYGNVRASGSENGLLGFDPVRAVWVLLTRVGVWEMGTDNAWVQRASSVEGVPPKWTEEGWGSAYDPVRKAQIFWLFDHTDDVYRFFAWDGAQLSVLPSEGLDPDELGSSPLALITVHPQHGLVLFMHDKGTFVLGAGQSAWVKQAGLPVGPPLMKEGHMIWDPGLAAFIVGPGSHEDAGSDAQRLFYKIGATTEEFGVRTEKSPLDDASYSNSRHAVWRGHWYATSSHCLETWRWDDATGWSKIVDEEAGRGGGWGWSEVALVVTDAALLAVRGDGAVFAFDGTTWTDREVEAPASFAKREDYAVAAEPDGSLVLWGGRIKERRLNDSFVLTGKTWRHVEQMSRVPSDFDNIKKEVFVEFSLAWDSKLGALVRFGYDNVAIRMSEIWQPFAPPSYKEVIGPRDRAHIPMHDPVSGETLLLDLEDLRVARFDVAGCVEVAKVAEAPLLKKEVEEPVTWKDLHDTCVWDPARLVLLAQDKDDRWGSFELDLAPAFAAAKGLGARTVPAPVPPPPPGATLYRVAEGGAVQVWGYRVLGAKVEVTAGPASAPRTETIEVASAQAAAEDAARLEAERRADGYRRALELDNEGLRRLSCVFSQKLKLLKAGGSDEDDEDEDEEEEEEEEGEDDEDGGEDKAPAPPPVIVGRLGGVPNGLAPDRWPRSGDEAMGFLMQIETGDLIPGYAAVAVFCTTDGTAGEDDDDEQTNNCAILLTAEQLAGPETAAPDDVAVMPPRPIAMEAPLGEIDEARMAPLIDRDISLSGALDALQASGDGLQEGNLSDKRGGLPAWVQHPARETGAGFVCQLDFDRISLDESWEDAGLSGCVFVFVEDGKATSFWQYT